MMLSQHQKVTCAASGVALDDLVYICTKIARQMDSDGLRKVFDAAETASSAIEEARPLLENAVKLVDEVNLWALVIMMAPITGSFYKLSSCFGVVKSP